MEDTTQNQNAPQVPTSQPEQVVQQPVAPVQPVEAAPAAPVAPVVQVDPAAQVPAQAEVQSNVPMEERILAAIAYIPFLTLLTAPMAVIKKPESKYCEFHASQALVLFVIWFASLIIAAIVPSIGGLLWLVLLVANVFGLVKAWSGSEYKIPGLGAVAAHIPVGKFFGTVKQQAGVEQTGQTPTQNPPSAQ